MLAAMVDAFRQPDLRARILFTFALLVVFRFVAHIPVPGVDVAAMNRFFQGNALLGMLDLFTGGAMRNLSVAAMGVYPYITATIIMQLMVPVIPSLERMSKEGEQGRAQINRISIWMTIPLAALQAYAQLFVFQRAGVIPGFGLTGENLLPTLAMVVSMTAATIFLVWLGELITQHGIGNGISIVIFAGIVASLPQLLGQSFLQAGGNLSGLLVFFVVGFLIVLFIVIFTEAQRRIPVQYGKTLFRGGQVRRVGGSTYIPLRVNSAGMIPLIFAISIMILPGTIASYFIGMQPAWVSNTADLVRRIFDFNSVFYQTLYFLLVVAFAFFYTIVIFQQQNLAENLQKNGGFIPGIRPGRPTQDYLIRVITRITWGGALFLGLVAIAPYIATLFTGVQGLQLSSTGLLIVVGVVLDTLRQLEAQLLMRHYEGFIR
ncbi:MAG: preprotein translocase subunit SecY [Chloroflexi bacterium]|nr:preprotein translocase subunit SecY [Chloroflexota bacterium]